MCYVQLLKCVLQKKGHFIISFFLAGKNKDVMAKDQAFISYQDEEAAYQGRGSKNRRTMESL
jgi:hypothetical protein